MAHTSKLSKRGDCTRQSHLSCKLLGFSKERNDLEVVMKFIGNGKKGGYLVSGVWSSRVHYGFRLHVSSKASDQMFRGWRLQMWSGNSALPTRRLWLAKGGSLCRPVLILGDLGPSKASSDSSHLIRQQVALAPR